MKGAIKRLIKTHGSAIEHYWYTDGQETSRGQASTLAAGAPETIMAIPDPGSRSLGFGSFGADVEADTMYLVDAAVDVDGGGGEGASRLKAHGKVYVVIDADESHQDQGFQLLHCELDPETDLVEQI